MSLEQWLEPNKCAVLVVDMQNDYRSKNGYLEKQGVDITMACEMVSRLAEFVREARHAGALVVFSQQTSFPGGLSDAAAYRHFRNKTRPGLGSYPVRGTWGHAICEDLEIAASDLIIEKTRPSSFYGTPINMLLRANDRSTVLVCGVATEGCVESTVRDVANYDYVPVIMDDCIASSKRELHEASLKVMTARYNTLSSSSLIEYWSSKDPVHLA